MSFSFDRYQKRKLISSYISVVISIALVLFLLGCLSLLVINTNKISNHFKEQVVLSVYIKDDAIDSEVNELKNKIKHSNFTKSFKYVSKIEAAELMKNELGENFMEFVGYNPLQNSIDVYLNGSYVITDSINVLKKNLLTHNAVNEVHFDNELIDLMNKNVKRITFWILIISGFFVLIAVLLINSSIRLAVYSKRFIIKTMQMVGATKRFIRRPFVLKSIQLGIIGSIIALLGLLVIIYLLNKSFPELKLLNNPLTIVFLCFGIFMLSIIITWISTFIATQRYLNLKTDSLYY